MCQNRENMNKKSVYSSIWMRIPSFCLLTYWSIGHMLDMAPLTVTVTTRIITFLVGNPYKPSFVTVTGWGGRSKL